MPNTPTPAIPQSAGHVAFICLNGSPVLEVFEKEGVIRRALLSNPVQPDGYRHSRWEAFNLACWRKEFEGARARNSDLSLR